MKMTISGIVVMVGIGIVAFIATKDTSLNAIPTTATSTEVSLVMSAQNATSSVNVDSVALPQAGFLAVRSIDNGRLGQIIEISKYHNAGTHTDTGFEPYEPLVPLGAIVHFVNESTKDMWVALNEHPGHSILPTFDQFMTGDQYVYVFDTIGS